MTQPQPPIVKPMTPLQLVVSRMNKVRHEVALRPGCNTLDAAKRAVIDLAINDNMMNKDAMLWAAAVLIIATESMPAGEGDDAPAPQPVKCERNEFCNCNGSCNVVA